MSLPGTGTKGSSRANPELPLTSPKPSKGPADPQAGTTLRLFLVPRDSAPLEPNLGRGPGRNGSEALDAPRESQSEFEEHSSSPGGSNTTLLSSPTTTTRDDKWSPMPHGVPRPMGT